LQRWNYIRLIADSNPGNYEFWDKVGQIVGNLTKLQTFSIHFVPYPFSESYDDDEANIVDWEILARILRFLRHKVALCACSEEHIAGNDEIQGLARAINGHPMISEFSSEFGFKYESVGSWWSALAALPSLERTTIGLQEHDTVISGLLKSCCEHLLCDSSDSTTFASPMHYAI
jgi:hypothetical protein